MTTHELVGAFLDFLPALLIIIVVPFIYSRTIYARQKAAAKSFQEYQANQLGELHRINASLERITVLLEKDSNR